MHKVRLLVQFKTLWMLVRGILSTAETMLYTFLLVLLILYVYACLGVEIRSRLPQHGAEPIGEGGAVTVLQNDPEIIERRVPFRDPLLDAHTFGAAEKSGSHAHCAVPEGEDPRIYAGVGPTLVGAALCGL